MPLKGETKSFRQRSVKARRYYLLVSSSGEKIAGDLLGLPYGLEIDERVRNIWIEDDIAPYNVEDQDGYWPMIAGQLTDGSHLLIAQSVLPAEDLQEFTLTVMIVILIMTVGLTIAMGWFLGRSILEKIDNINNTAQAIRISELSQRVAISGKGDEFDQLGGHLNSMLDRIEQLMTGMRQVTDNVAHDLRSPLSRLRSRLEVTLLKPRNEAEYKQSIQETIIDVDSLIKTFNALLEIAQTEAGSFRGEWELVNLSVLSQSIGELYEDLAEENNQHLTIDVDSRVMVTGNRHLLTLMLNNLLDNAIKYTPTGGSIELRVIEHDKFPTIIIADSGPGIPYDQYGEVFERFSRLDSARSSEGNGLGLSLVKAIAELHHAHLKLNDNQPGLRVELSFPQSSS